MDDLSHRALLDRARRILSSLRHQLRQRIELVDTMRRIEIGQCESGRAEPVWSDGTHELELRAIDRTLARIAVGRFGCCELCEGPIELDRLTRIPWSRCCLSCVTFWERELRNEMLEEPVDPDEPETIQRSRGAASTQRDIAAVVVAA